MATIGIRIVYAGNNSLPGHMYAVFKGDDGSVTTFGHFPQSALGGLGGPGGVRQNEDLTSHELREGVPGTNGVPNVARDFPVSASDYQRALDYARNAAIQRGDPSKYWGQYDPLYRSCVDFTWNVARQAGLKRSDWFEGFPLPSWNKGAVDDAYFDYFRREEFNREFRRGLNWAQPRDPLILDLDNDGIELTASNSSILFDHNADGIKTGSQWARADDGMLVRDLNGNGTIDSGRELFGDQTVLPNGSLATNGFQALSALDKDANGIADGVFDANDVAYSELKVWRDLNQDGVSQSNELLGLAESGVSAINLVQTPTQTAQGKSTFTKTVSGVDTNGNPVTTTSTQTVQNVNLTSNTFYRAFSDDPAITPQAAQLPQMQGAGLVRDLREAMSLGTVQSTALQTSLEVFKGATSAKARQSQADAIVQAWANTSGLPDALARNPILPASAGLANWYVSSPGQAIANFAQSNPALYQQLTLLERFNGQAILERYAHLVAANYYDPAQHRYFGYTYYAVSIEGQRLAFFQSAYDSLKASTYQSLYLQTAGKALLDQVELVIDDKGLRLGFDEPELKRRCIRSGKSFATKKVVVNVSFTVTKCRFIQPKRVPKGLWRNFAGLNCSNLNSSQNLNTEIFDTFVQTGCATSKFA